MAEEKTAPVPSDPETDGFDPEVGFEVDESKADYDAEEQNAKEVAK